METPEYVVKIVRLSPRAYIPSRARDGDAGYDLFSPEYFKLAPFERKIIPLGIKIEIPSGHYGKICDRSGHAAKRGIHVMAGTIDSGYRGEVGVVLINLNGFDWLKQNLTASKTNHPSMFTDKFFGSPAAWEVKEGEPIAQIIFRKYDCIKFEEVAQLSDSIRGEGGWGHTSEKKV